MGLQSPPCFSFNSVSWIVSSSARVSTAPPAGEGVSGVLRRRAPAGFSEGRAVGSRGELHAPLLAALGGGRGGGRSGPAIHRLPAHPGEPRHAPFLACRGDDAGRAASELFCCDDDAFRDKFPEIAQRHDLYRSMASEQARASANWEAIKLTTLEKLQELLHLRPDLECSLRMRQPQCTSMPSEIVPLGLRGSKRHRRKRVDSKPARELALFFQRKRLSSSLETGHSGDSGRKRSRLQDVNCTGIAHQPFDPTECFKRPRMAGDVSEPGEISA